MKKTILTTLMAFSILLIVIGCASGSAIITGQVREPLNPSTVILYSEPPENYEVIGIVMASSNAGFTAQQDFNYAVEELKKQAAKLGANGVLIENIGKNTSSAIGSSGNGSFYGYSTSEHSISGKAIFVQ